MKNAAIATLRSTEYLIGLAGVFVWLDSPLVPIVRQIQLLIRLSLRAPQVINNWGRADNE